jgi:hypothetical protein
VLPVDLLRRANGAVRTIALPEDKTLQVTISEGAEDRQMLRLKQQGMASLGGGPPGMPMSSFNRATSLLQPRTTIFMSRFPVTPL